MKLFELDSTLSATTSRHPVRVPEAAVRRLQPPYNENVNVKFNAMTERRHDTNDKKRAASYSKLLWAHVKTFWEGVGGLRPLTW